MRFQRFLIRLTYWEYWPFGVVYAPIVFYWLWLCLKARSFFFFNASNPTIRNGGYLMESKKEIYDLLPSGTYPTTVYCPKDQPLFITEIELQEAKLSFPMIAKPDIGLRGLGVELLHSAEEWERYHANAKADYLLQQYISYKHEVGLFYYRIPGEKMGLISGITGKVFLRLVGNGRETIGELLLKEPRFFLQIPALFSMYGDRLRDVLNKGEELLLVPFGNHSRGAKFTDISHQISAQLTETIDTLCQSIPGFYFGRLDIKYDNWKDFCAGKNFSIIELNGAGSEPAHVYDPGHSILFAWKEIIRHLRLLYVISIKNKQRGIPFMTMKEGLQMFRDNKKQVQLLSTQNSGVKDEEKVQKA